MKPTGVPPDPDAARPKGGAAEPAVRDRLLAIDTAALQRMLQIRSEQARIQEYRSRADENRSQVEQTVWRRVVDDYERRHAALEKHIAPLEAQARGELQKLCTLLDAVSRTNDEARLARQELEFRHAVGELDDSQLEKAIEAPDAVLARCRTELHEIEALKARFVDAFGPDEHLTQAVAADPLPLARSIATAEPVPMRAAAPSDLTTLAGEGDETVGNMAAVSPPRGSSPADGAGRTILMPAAALVADASDGVGPVEYRLAAVNVIGRSDDAQIQLTRPGVSRRHALVSMESSGFTIKDLKSQNGTLVNGTPVGEARLADGDRIEIGEVLLTFRAPWPATA